MAAVSQCDHHGQCHRGPWQGVTAGGHGTARHARQHSADVDAASTQCSLFYLVMREDKLIIGL